MNWDFKKGILIRLLEKQDNKNWDLESGDKSGIFIQLLEKQDNKKKSVGICGN